MGEIKSTWEIVLEKAEKIGRASEEELFSYKYETEGKKVAARYFQEKDFDILKALSEYPKEALPYLLKGINEVLVRNIVLPRNEDQWQEVKRALEGIKIIKKGRSDILRISREIEQLLLTYKQMREQLYFQFKSQFESKLAGVEQALSQQLGVGLKIDVESQPQFQEEWLSVQAELNERFEKQLNPLKKGLLL